MFNFGDEKVILKSKGKEYCGAELKKLVSGRAAYLAVQECKNLLLCEEDNFEFVLNFLAGIYSGKELFLLTDKNKRQILEGDFIDTVQASDMDFVIPEVNPDEVFINFYTSGSTGRMKKARKSLQNLLNEANDLYEKFSPDKNLVFITTTKMSHMFGMTFALMFPLVNGYVIDTDIIKFPEQIEQQDYVFISTPSFLDRMAKYNINPVPPKYIFTAGDKLKNSTFAFFEEKSNVIDIYGSTECGIIAYRTSSTADWLTAFSDVEVSVDSDSVIHIKSRYFLENEQVMGDLIELDGNRFKITGRADRILKIQEKRISAVELEEYLNKNELIENSYCFKYNEKIAAAVVLTQEGKEKLLETGSVELIKILKSHVAAYSELYPQKWRFLPEIPKTVTGKIDREKLEMIFGLNLSLPLVFDINSDKNCAQITLAFLKNSNFFNGHFPDLPILPGVVQLFFAHFYAENIFKIEIPCNKIKKIKFTKVIKPDAKIQLILKSNDLSVDYTYTDGQNIFSSGTFIK